MDTTTSHESSTANDRKAPDEQGVIPADPDLALNIILWSFIAIVGAFLLYYAAHWALA